MSPEMGARWRLIGPEQTECTGHVVAIQIGKPSNFGTSSNRSSHTALLDEKICAVGNIVS